MLKLPFDSSDQFSRVSFVLSRCVLLAFVFTVAVLNPLQSTERLMAQENQAVDASISVDQKTADVKAGSSLKKTKKGQDAAGWKPLFDKSSLKGWKVTNYGGEGEATVTKSVLMIEQGVDLSGVTTTRKDLPADHYEVEFEARRTEGNDFFVGFTFPVRGSSCSLICGGWGGGICGISSIDMMDASENETTSYSAFNNGQWYKVKLKVDGDNIAAWMDGKSLLEVDLDDRKVDTRFEMDLSKPMGFSSYQSTAEIRNARYRLLKKKTSQAKPAGKVIEAKPAVESIDESSL
ncbi:MAG: DUF1080 domain-containing protein [Fuerstiella sp.]